MATQQRSALEEALKGMGTTAGNVVQGATKNLGNFLQGASQGANNIVNNFQQDYGNFSRNYAQDNAIKNATLQNFSNGVKSTLNNMWQAPSNFVKDLPFNAAQISLNMQKSGKTPITFSQANKKAEAMFKMEEPLYRNGLGDAPVDNLRYDMTPNSGSSAGLNDQVTSPNYYIPDANPQLEAVKRQVLSQPNLRPAAKNYLSQIPVTAGTPSPNEMQWGGHVGGTKGEPNQYIVVNPHVPKWMTLGPDASPEQRKAMQPKLDEQYLSSVIQHELLHQTPELLPTSLYTPKDKQQIQEYTDRWTKKYMDQPGKLVGEMFAEQDLPPAYYYHIFSKLNPEATPQDFINEIKNYVLNYIKSKK